MAITVIRHGITLDELDAWGSVADLGSEILEGEVKAFGKMTAGAPTDPVSAAYFGTTAGKFRMTYPFSEQATVVSGESASPTSPPARARSTRPATAGSSARAPRCSGRLPTAASSSITTRWLETPA